jgi:hypothetical protein
MSKTKRKRSVGPTYPEFCKQFRASKKLQKRLEGLVKDTLEHYPQVKEIYLEIERLEVYFSTANILPAQRVRLRKQIDLLRKKMHEKMIELLS